MEELSTIPVVMTFAPSDPTGSIGIQADIETLFGLGCHCCPIISGITAQNSSGLKDYTPTPTSMVIEQAKAILEEYPISACKIAAHGSIENLVALYTVLKDFAGIPVVLSILPNSLGTPENPDNEMINAITSILCPIATVVIVDCENAQILAPGADTIDACAQNLMDTGCEYILMKNCNAYPDILENTLYGNHRMLEKYNWVRVKGNYRGCGCTLTAAIAGLLSHKLTAAEAILEAQKYTLECIRKGVRLGVGSRLPDRLFWARYPNKNSQSSTA